MIRVIKISEIENWRNSGTGLRVRNGIARKQSYRLSRRQIVLVVLLLLLLMGSGIGYVWSGFEGTQIGYDVTQLKREENSLRALNKKLKVELENLKSPQRLEKEARAIGLKAAAPEQIIVLR